MQTNPLHRRIGQFLWWIALVLVVAGIVLLAAPVSIGLSPVILIGAGLVLLGVNTLLGGELIAGSGPRTFAARGQVVRGLLDVRAGWADLTIDGGPNDRVATVQYGPLGKPGFQVHDGVARLRLTNAFLRPNVTLWRTDLASNVLWDVIARSSLGNLRLNLGGLRLERVEAYTWAGRLSLTCPDRGYVEMQLTTGIGEIEVTVPSSAGAEIVVESGMLGTVTSRNDRLIALGHRYVTPDYEDAPSQVSIRIKARSGDVYLI